MPRGVKRIGFLVVTHLLSTNGFKYVWQNQGVDNKKLFLFIFLQGLQDIYTKLER
jgi:prophage maintenance system killer protein